MLVCLYYVPHRAKCLLRLNTSHLNNHQKRRDYWDPALGPGPREVQAEESLGPGPTWQSRYSTWEPEEHILDPRLVMAYEEKEERDRASGYRKRGPKPKRLLLQPRKAHKYLRLSRKKFPPRGSHLESHSHRRELSLQEPPAPDVLQAAAEWEPTEQPPEEDADADLADGPPPWTPALPSSEVTVTDITANSITVTFREAQAAEGFFRDRSGKL
ncbi:chromobox protein homolog 7 isoform X5 [Castor canadensis]|uniref:Chromobox protein homolog 7 isoform X5 n=1 Tax=Castor canadensis TaxID=51338 RepID=A0AC58NG20_CASCN